MSIDLCSVTWFLTSTQFFMSSSLSPCLTSISTVPDSNPEFLSPQGSPTFSVLPSYWPFNSLSNQSEGTLAKAYLHSVKKLLSHNTWVKDSINKSQGRAYALQHISVYYYQGQGHQGNLCQSPRAEVVISQLKLSSIKDKFLWLFFSMKWRHSSMESHLFRCSQAPLSSEPVLCVPPSRSPFPIAAKGAPSSAFLCELTRAQAG